MFNNVILPPEQYMQKVPVRRVPRTIQKQISPQKLPQQQFPIRNSIRTNQFPIRSNIPQNQIPISTNGLIYNNQTFPRPAAYNNSIPLNIKKQSFYPSQRSSFQPDIFKALPFQQLLTLPIQERFSPPIPTFRMSDIKQNNQPQKIRIYDQQNNPIDLNLNITLSKDGKVVGASMISQQDNCASSSHGSRSSKLSHSIEPNFDFHIQQESVNCVICNESFLVCQIQKHLVKHQKAKKSYSENKILHKSTFLKKKQKGPIIKPIVQPQEYNLQYQPNQYILHKDIVYMSQPALMKQKFLQDQQVQIGQKSQQRPRSQSQNNHLEHIPVHQSRYQFSHEMPAEEFQKLPINRQTSPATTNRGSQNQSLASHQSHSSYMQSGSNFPPCDQICQDEKEGNISFQDCCMNLQSEKQDAQQYVNVQNIFMKRNLKKQPFFAENSKKQDMLPQMENSFKKNAQMPYQYRKQQQKDSSGKISSEFSFNKQNPSLINNIIPQQKHKNQSNKLPYAQEIPQEFKTIKSQQKKSSLKRIYQSKVQLAHIEESPKRKSYEKDKIIQKYGPHQLSPLGQCAQEKSPIKNSTKEEPSRLTARQTVKNPFRDTDTFTQVQKLPISKVSEEPKQGTQQSEIIPSQMRNAQQYTGFNPFIQAQIEPINTINDRYSSQYSNINSSIEGNPIKQTNQLPNRNTTLATNTKKKKIAKNTALAWF